MIEMESFLSDPTDPATKLWKEIMDERQRGPVHQGHGIDPSCRERMTDQGLKGECLGSPTPLVSEALHAAHVAQERCFDWSSGLFSVPPTKLVDYWTTTVCDDPDLREGGDVDEEVTIEIPVRVGRHAALSVPLRGESDLAVNIMALQSDIKNLMLGRHEKYGPGNIAEFGETGILVRMADKFARLKEGNKNYDDETVDNTLDDIIGYALIWKLWRRGEWPGSK